MRQREIYIYVNMYIYIYLRNILKDLSADEAAQVSDISEAQDRSESCCDGPLGGGGAGQKTT